MLTHYRDENMCSNDVAMFVRESNRLLPRKKKKNVLNDSVFDDEMFHISNEEGKA